MVIRHIGRSMQRAAMKRKAMSSGGNPEKNETGRLNGQKRQKVSGSCFHSFSECELSQIQAGLLKWYDANKRDLPWRKVDKTMDINQRAYAVWVSEIMLQQTQVATVIDYYTKWMKKWPTLQNLAAAQLEEVNEMWSGLGYYSRGKRLHLGAQKVVTELEGEMPRHCEALQKELPGVGRYTAGAIASIALGEKTGVVDGNVIRVLSRLRMIGADSTSNSTMDKFWELANELAKCDRAGDLNQSLMELGATVCTPKTPECPRCPLKEVCKAYAKVDLEKKQNSIRLTTKERESTEIEDIECLANDCKLCLPASESWDSSLGVQNYPRKAKKKAAREQTSDVCIVCQRHGGGQRTYLLLQRPHKGLLAGLWEFPSSERNAETCDLASAGVIQQLSCDHGIELDDIESEEHLGEVVHIFSHIHQTYVVSMVTVAEGNVSVTSERPARWLSKEELGEAAVPTAMRKVFKLCCKEKLASKVSKDAQKKKERKSEDPKRQKSIMSFFKPKP